MSNTTIMDRLGEVCPQSCGQVEFEYFATSENIDADEACAKAMLPGRTSLRVSLYLRVTQTDSGPAKYKVVQLDLTTFFTGLDEASMSSLKGEMHWLDHKSNHPDASYCKLKVKNDLAYLR